MGSLLLCACDKEVSDCYYQEVLTAVASSSIHVQHDIEGKGKGLIASKQLDEGETVFTERPLVSLQHLDNRKSALVCQLCLRYVGSIEQQIGHKLQCLVDGLRAAQRDNGQDENAEDGSEVDLDAALQAGERLEQVYNHVSPEQISALCSLAVTLPLAHEFRLPPPVPCRRGCGAVYCGPVCEAAAWEHHHCLLCTSPAPAPAAAPQHSTHPVPSANPQGPAASAAAAGPPQAAAGAEPAAGEASTSAAAGGCSGPSGSGGDDGGGGDASGAEHLYGIRVDRRAVAAFVEHASETNEIFLLAAQVVAATLLRAARTLLMPPEAVALDHVVSPLEAPEAASGSPGAADMVAPGFGSREGGGLVLGLEAAANTCSVAAGGSAAGGGGGSGGSSGSDGTGIEGSKPGGGGGGGGESHRSALLAAWRPYLHGWKRCWWDAVAVPDDVDDEQEFRGQLRELASDSLELLSAAISDPRFAPDLMQLQVFGSIVGMFELNNLGLSVSSPVEDFFLAVDEMEEGPEKQRVVQVTQPLLDALDTEYATPCEATAFMALQSCINHSCDPNCTAACDTGDRTVTVLAQRDIGPGEEITLSYIDVNLPYKQRQAELRDYGFVCRCSRCVTEAAAAKTKRQGGAAAKGVKVGGGGSRRR